MANSENIQARLCDYIDGQLDEKSRQEIEQYLAAHPADLRLIEELRQTKALLGELPRESAPADIAESIQARLERSVLLEADDRIGPPALRISRWPRYAAAAAVVLLASGLGVIVYHTVPLGGPAPSTIAHRADESAEPAFEDATVRDDGRGIGLAEAPATDPADDPASQPIVVDEQPLAEGAIALRARDAAPDAAADQPADAAALFDQPPGGTLFLVVETDNPALANVDITGFFARNSIAWSEATVPMPDPLQLGHSQAVIGSRHMPTQTRLTAPDATAAVDVPAERSRQDDGELRLQPPAEAPERPLDPGPLDQVDPEAEQRLVESRPMREAAPSAIEAEDSLAESIGPARPQEMMRRLPAADELTETDSALTLDVRSEPPVSPEVETVQRPTQPAGRREAGLDPLEPIEAQVVRPAPPAAEYEAPAQPGADAPAAFGAPDSQLLDTENLIYARGLTVEQTMQLKDQLESGRQRQRAYLIDPGEVDEAQPQLAERQQWDGEWERRLAVQAEAQLTPRAQTALDQAQAKHRQLAQQALESGPAASAAVVKPQDMLSIEIEGVGEGEAMHRVVRVDEQGRIDLPLIGPVDAAGLTDAQLSRRIEGVYRRGNFLTDGKAAVQRIEAEQPSRVDVVLIVVPVRPQEDVMAPVQQPAAVEPDIEPVEPQTMPDNADR